MEAILLVVYIVAGLWGLKMILGDWDPWSTWDSWTKFTFKLLLALGFGWAFIIVALIKIVIVKVFLSNKNN